MSTPKPASEWTQDEIDTYLSELSNSHFQERLPLFIIVYSSCVLGVWGNSLTFVVYLKHFPHNSTRIFVLALSLTDFTTTLIGSPLSSMITVYFYSFYSDAACKAFYTIPTVLTSLSVLLLGLIAYDRYRHVCRPHSRQLSPRVALLMILVSFAVSLGSSLPLIPVYNLISIPTNVPGINGSHCMTAFQKVDKIYSTVFSAFSGIVFVGSLTLMIFCYVNIGIVILCKLRLPRERPYSSQEPSTLFSYSQSENIPHTHDTETSDSIPLQECTTAEINYLKTNNDKASDSSKEPSRKILENSRKLLQRRKTTILSSVVDVEGIKELSSLHSSEFGTEGKTEVSPLQSPVFNTQVEQEPEKKINNILDINSSSSLNQNALVAGTDASDTDVDDSSANEPNETTVKIDSSQSKTSLDDDVKQTPSFSQRVCPTASCRLCPCGRRRTRHAATTLMMFVLTVLFVVCFLPFIIVSSTTPPDKIPCLGLSRVEMNLCEMAVFFFPVLNSVVNPFVYSMFSYRFRKESQRYLCWLRKS